jgi:cation diffusion facilitator CzcD-associated flavoprotein CzcO
MSAGMRDTPGTQRHSVESGDGAELELLDVVVIGAGVAGLYALYRFRGLGLKVRVYEQGSGVGGTWYWNRYPGCRFDTSSPTYSYSFSEELLQEWDWRERFSPQADNERYVNYVADKFDLRRDIRLDTRVVSMVFNEDESHWLLTMADGRQVLGRFVVAATGKFSASYVPDEVGLKSFKGTWLHTGRWPKEGIDLAGKRVGVVGTGSTGVQVIPEVAKIASNVIVFQRTPNYCVPIENRPLTSDEIAEIKTNYAELFRRCAESDNLSDETPFPHSGLEFTPEERQEMYEEWWTLPGHSKFKRGFRDIMKPGPINEEYSEFVRGKIRGRIHDPRIAQLLVPDDHPFGSKRVPGETDYYETFNRDNVELHSVKADPIERITPTGIVTRNGKNYELDVIIFATGWDVVTGPLNAMSIQGEGGQTLKDKFKDGLRSYMFLQCAGFPNLFMIAATDAGYFVRSLEPVVDWIGDTICYVLKNGHEQIVPRPAAEDAWWQHQIEVTPTSIYSLANSCFIGANIPGKPRGPLFPFADGEKAMQEKRRAESDNGYPGFLIRSGVGQPEGNVVGSHSRTRSQRA